ncbi:MAG: hypothetical protein Q9214_006331 [Letrouitia sp. 1 TL-2023]
MSPIPRLTATSLEDSSEHSHISAVNQALRGPGVGLVDLKFPDLESQYLERLVLGLGKHYNHGPPITHSSSRGWFWDVKPQDTNPIVHQARSETKLPFPWHTDCSYESKPPQFFALHVLYADKFGGGTLSALNVSRVLHQLGPATLESLCRPEFRITVPPEFSKDDTGSIVGPLVSRAEHKSGGLTMRFRADIVEPLSLNAKRALETFKQRLGDVTDTRENARINLTPQVLPDNTIVLMDNGRWLHARTEIRDPGRHLRRVRWARREFLD